MEFINVQELFLVVFRFMNIIFFQFFRQTGHQSHYIDVAQEDIFMEQKMWFGLVLGSTEKKNWGADYEQLWGRFFPAFGGKN